MKKLFFKLALFLIVAVIALVAIFVIGALGGGTATNNEQLQTSSSDFGKQNYASVVVDTFLSLVKRNYNDANIEKSGGVVKLTLKNNNQEAFAFINGNDGLIKNDLSEFGISIKIDKEKNELKAKFDIEHNAVNVPNDVLINLTEKIVNNK